MGKQKQRHRYKHTCMSRYKQNCWFCSTANWRCGRHTKDLPSLESLVSQTDLWPQKKVSGNIGDGSEWQILIKFLWQPSRPRWCGCPFLVIVMAGNQKSISSSKNMRWFIGVWGINWNKLIPLRPRRPRVSRVPCLMSAIREQLRLTD